MICNRCKANMACVLALSEHARSRIDSGVIGPQRNEAWVCRCQNYALVTLIGKDKSVVWWPAASLMATDPLHAAIFGALNALKAFGHARGGA